jgi:hypothetical protein
VIPAAEFINAVQAISKLGDESVLFQITKKRLHLTSDKLSYWVDLIEGEFPDWHRIKPNRRNDENATVIELEFGDSYKMIKDITTNHKDSKEKGLTFHVEPAGALLMPKGGDKVTLRSDQIKANLAIDHDFRLNPVYVANILSTLGPGTTGYYNYENRQLTEPVVFENGNKIGVLMPMHIAEGR